MAHSQHPTPVIDLIGDIHGCADTLEALLTVLGYSSRSGAFTHPTRTAIFLGDYIDRGPHQRRTVEIVRAMVESGSAQALMGNHEFNAIAWATPHPEGRPKRRYLRAHGSRNRRQHEAFLSEYEQDPSAYADAISWFKTLPLWLDLGELRLVHACWDDALIKRVEEALEGNRLNEAFLIDASTKGTWQYDALETLLKGREIELPHGASFSDKDGNKRHSIRLRWWDPTATTYRRGYMGPEDARASIPDTAIETDEPWGYEESAPPVFFGHYWLHGDPVPLADNIACLDYSVAKPRGQLVAYRWDGEQRLTKDKFVAVHRQEPW